MKRWKIILAFAAVFVAGTVVGGLTVMRFVPPPLGRVPDAAEMTAHMMRRLKADLALRPDQEASIQPILAHSVEQSVGLHREFLHWMGDNIDACDLEIEIFLDAKQKAQFESIRAKRPHFGNDH